MTIATPTGGRRLGLAASAVATAAFLLLTSACGSDTGAGQAPASIRAPRASSSETRSPADQEECLVSRAKVRSDRLACEVRTPPAEPEPQLYLPPSVRPVPLPGQAG